jgi:hypothetical protein
MRLARRWARHELASRSETSEPMTTMTLFKVLFHWWTQLQLKSCCRIGSERMRLPVAAKMALQTAGAVGGNGGSPKPLGGLCDDTK